VRAAELYLERQAVDSEGVSAFSFPPSSATADDSEIKAAFFGSAPPARRLTKRGRENLLSLGLKSGQVQILSKDSA